MNSAEIKQQVMTLFQSFESHPNPTKDDVEILSNLVATALFDLHEIAVALEDMAHVMRMTFERDSG